MVSIRIALFIQSSSTFRPVRFCCVLFVCEWVWVSAYFTVCSFFPFFRCDHFFKQTFFTILVFFTHSLPQCELCNMCVEVFRWWRILHVTHWDNMSICKIVEYSICGNCVTCLFLGVPSSVHFTPSFPCSCTLALPHFQFIPRILLCYKIQLDGHFGISIFLFSFILWNWSM